jgi:hypothetical protein
MLATIVIDHLMETKQNDSFAVAYVYCNYIACGEQDCPSLFAAILRQLVQARLVLNKPLVDLHNKHADRGSRSLVHEVREALKATVASICTIYVVVDAVDECSNDEGTQMQLVSTL